MNHSKTMIVIGLVVSVLFIFTGFPRFSRNSYAEQINEKKQAIQFPQGKTSDLPFSPAIQCGNMLFLSGVIGTDLDSGELVSLDVAEQTHKCLNKLEAVLKEAGMDMSHAVKATVYLTNIEDYRIMNQAYAEHFKDIIPPARACVQVAGLVKGAKVEISMIAVK